jgi:hypothetical protein
VCMEALRCAAPMHPLVVYPVMLLNRVYHEVYMVVNRSLRFIFDFYNPLRFFVVLWMLRG